jgi:20S proteasome alpha/beta subunit
MTPKPPPIRFGLNPPRLPKRKPMTIAIGFHAKDGVVLCADMQRTIGDMKTYDGKVDLDIFHQSGAILAIAGAGHDDYIQTAKSYLLDGLSKRCPWKTLERDLRNRLLSFFDEHLNRWANFPSIERPSVELLIGVTGKNQHPMLFHYEGTSFSRIHGSKSIGLGILLAQDLLDRYRSIYTADQASSLATFILSKVKKGVQGCGGPTHIVALRKGMDFALTEKKDIEDLEKELAEIDGAMNKQFIESFKKNPLRLSWHSEWVKKTTDNSQAALDQNTGSIPNS